MSGRFADERGFGLVEVLLSASLMLVVLGATLVAFNQFEIRNNTNQLQQDSQDQNRFAIDQLARQLRNLASPTDQQPLAIDRAEPYDLIFQTADPFDPTTQSGRNLRRVRYCLDTSDPSQQRLWTMSLPLATGLSTETACPGTTWANREVAAEHVVNRVTGQDRAVFAYDRSKLIEITHVRLELWVDVNPGKSPAESKLATSVFLRNQNRPPTASFTATPLGDRYLKLNGSASIDPEGDSLQFAWFDDTTKIGTGITCDCQATGTGVRTIKLIVLDQSQLTGDATEEVDVK
jgi:type II secretory pathway component PulJ